MSTLGCLKRGIRYVLHGVPVKHVTVLEMTGFNLYLAENPVGRVYLPGEVAETAYFLLSDASGCISVQIVSCNNGKTINPWWK